MNEIIRHNLELMRCNKEGGMQYLLIRESIGGTAGMHGQYPCAGANFFYDGTNGKMEYFGNWQDVPPEIRARNQKDIFRVVWPIGTIVSYSPPTSTTALTRRNLEETVKHYNDWRRSK